MTVDKKRAKKSNNVELESQWEKYRIRKERRSGAGVAAREISYTEGEKKWSWSPSQRNIVYGRREEVELGDFGSAEIICCSK